MMNWVVNLSVGLGSTLNLSTLISCIGVNELGLEEVLRRCFWHINSSN
jgi:hypothetical protein